MSRRISFGVLILCANALVAQSTASPEATPPPKFDAFEVATVKPVDVDLKAGRWFRMDGTHRWVATNFTLEALIALAYDMNPRTISGGPGWMDEQKFTIEAVTPGRRRADQDGADEDVACSASGSVRAEVSSAREGVCDLRTDGVEGRAEAASGRQTGR